MLNSADFVFARIGLWSIGAAPAMINYHLTGQALVYCLKVSRVEIMLIDGDEAALRRMEDVKAEVQSLRYLMLREARRKLADFSSEAPTDELRKGVQGGDQMALFYTSGTTKRLHATDDGSIRAWLWQYVCMPYYHGTGGINAMAQLVANSTLLIAPKFSVSSFWPDIIQSRAT
ncbi:hypothetical protein QBC40DRAFT_251632 [Triangularia verruculosa]|uniref:AMP-dependent synthetase/ligase domain-containing protein n=1 Tax=Triangularia verruculosa TaxID=2587418 RepID=A0AAN6XSF7_9PEZI|nr:hypothetical protein QBC40DRAFT_251632 [Triangularia verruculosa]